MYLLENMGVSGMTGEKHPRGSLHSLAHTRRGSFDVKSIGSDIGSKENPILSYRLLSLILSTRCAYAMSALLFRGYLSVFIMI